MAGVRREGNLKPGRCKGPQRYSLFLIPIVNLINSINSELIKGFLPLKFVPKGSLREKLIIDY